MPYVTPPNGDPFWVSDSNAAQQYAAMGWSVTDDGGAAPLAGWGATQTQQATTPAAPAPASTPAPPASQPPAASSTNVRLLLRDPATGMVNTGRADGSDPRSFPDFESARLYILNNGETLQEVENEQQAFDIVRQYTGNPDYAGYGANYQAPTPTADSPAGMGQNYTPTWATPGGSRTPGGTPNTTGDTTTGTTPGTGSEDLDELMRQLGVGNIPEIGAITLGENPQIPQGFSGDFNNFWQQFVSGQADDLGKFYSPGFGDWATMTPAQLDLAGVPQPTAQTPESNSALDFLMTGQGFSPEIMSLMRGRATDDITRDAAGQRSSAKIMAQQAGLSGSPAAMAVEAQVNRRAGDANNQAQNALSVENAMRGLENLRLAAPMELGRDTSSAAMANQMALENANRLYSGMVQNTQNTQAANLANTQNTQERNMARAGAQAGTMSNMGQAYNSALLGKAVNADEQNAANEINRRLNQAQLDRQRAMYNVDTGENRYRGALGAFTGLISGTNPGQYSIGAANIGAQYMPNFIGANAALNAGSQLNTVVR